MNKLEQAARALLAHWDLGEFSTRMDETITALREAIAEIDLAQHIRPKGKSVIAKMWVDELAEQAEQEPVAWMDSEGFPWSKQGVECRTTPDTYTPLFPAPVRTKDLTADEIDKAWRSVDYTVPYEQFRMDVARAVIAADREKNK